MWWLDRWAIFIMRSVWAVGFHSPGIDTHTHAHTQGNCGDVSLLLSGADSVHRKKKRRRRQIQMSDRGCWGFLIGRISLIFPPLIQGLNLNHSLVLPVWLPLSLWAFHIRTENTPAIFFPRQKTPLATTFSGFWNYEITRVELYIYYIMTYVLFHSSGVFSVNLQYRK